MADSITIRIALDAGDITQATGRIRSGIKSALDAAIPDAREAGKRLGDALAGGMAEGLAKARRLRTQIDQILDPAKRQRANETSEQRHQQKINEIRERAAAQQANITARSESQQASIRARAQVQAERDARRFAESQARAFERAKPPDSALGFFKRYSSTLREAGESVQQFGYTLTALSAGFVNLARTSVQSAIDIDKQINVLKSLTGSSEAAEKRYAELVKTALKTPGLTASLAGTLDAQLRVASVTEQTINRILPAIGKLNAVSPLGDPQKFAANLVQLVTQNFERTDLKELVGQSPLAGEVIKSIFNVDNATNAKAIRESAQKLGITTTDAFFAAFADAAAKNPKLQGVTESLGTQIEKLRDRVLVALRPLGLAIIQAITPLIEKAVPIIERVSSAFAALPEPVKQAIIVIGALVAAIGPLILVFGGLLQTFGALGNIITVIAGAGGLGAIASAAAPVVAIIAALAAGAAALYLAWQNNFLGIREITASVFAEVARFATENLKYIVDFYNQNLPIFKEAINTALAAIRAFWAENGATITTIVRETWDIISTVVGTAIKNILDVLKILAQVINGDISGAFVTFAGIVQRNLEAAFSVIKSFAERAFAQMKLFGSVILDAGKNLATAGLKIGYDIVAGIIQGIKSRFGDVSNTMKELGKGAIAAAKFTLGIQSPSKVFFEIGQNTATGYILGLEASKSRVRTATKDLLAASIVDLPDPDKIQAAIRRTQHEQDSRRNFSLDQLVPLAGFNPSAIGADSLSSALNLQQVEDVIPPLTAAADAVRRLGAESILAAQSVSPLENAFSGLIDSVGGLLESGIDKLTRKLGVFGGFVKSVLGSIAQQLLGGLGGALGGRGGISGFIGNVFGRLFGGGSAGASSGVGSFLTGGFAGGGGGFGQFATGGFAGGGGAASILGGGSGGGGILGALTQAIGGGISAPRSITLGGLPIAPNIPIPGAAQIGGGGATGGLGSLLGGGLGSLFKGIGFGKAPGSGGALAGALPLLGLSLGSSLGTDRLTSILGGAAGGLLGIGLTAAPSIIGAGGALSGLGFLAPLFSNPFTAIAAGLALPAIFLLGRARQRRRDESTSGDYLQQAVDGIKDLRKQVERNEITLNVSQARDLFNTQILQPFIDQIKTIKTKSVRESRLKNQTVDLRNLFEKEVIPAVQAQKTRQGINDKLVPEFAVGGYHRGVGLALLHDREAILNLSQQSKLQAIAGQNILQQIGVPDAAPAPVDAAPAFARGGIFTAPARNNAAPTINMTVQLVVSPDDATGILNAAASTDDGQVILVNAQKVARRNGIGRTRI